jgi:hypothetical protein
MASPSALPCASAELSRRLETVAAQYLVDRYSGPGNPMQAEFLRLGSVIATKVPFVPRNPLMNAVHGLEDPVLLPQLLSFYAQTGQPCWIGVAPHVEPAMTDALIEHGFKPASSKAVLYGRAAAPRPSAPDVQVTPVGAAELDAFLDTINVGFDVPPGMLAGLRRNQSFWCDVAHWRLYLARVDGVPAGAAVLALADGLGYLAAGATLSAFRNRGVHAALVAQRLADAAGAGCELVTGQADFLGASHRNQQRAGLQLAHVRQDWTNA